MGALDEFLSKLDAGFEPKGLGTDEELRRTRLVLSALCDKAARAAEEKHPGIGAAIARASRKEEELARKAADASFMLSPKTYARDANGCWIEDE